MRSYNMFLRWRTELDVSMMFRVTVIIILLFDSIAMSAQNLKEVKGQVLDEDNLALIGATVRLKDGSVGTVTDMDGNFKLTNIPSKGKLIISCIGFQSKEIAVAAKLKIVLLEDTKKLDEVVVVGYGSMKKRDLTGAITSVSSDDIEKRMSINVYEALQGQTAGVQIISNSGAPGEGASIRIRGTSTFGDGVNPLYVVDGQPMEDIESINPNDIESMEVLKDAASAAIYGSRSANGVILISTKKGKVGKPKVDIKYQRSYNSIAHTIPQTTANEFRYYDDIRRLVGGTPSTNTVDSLKPFFNSDINMQDYLFHSSVKDQIDLSARAASDRMKYYASAGFLHEDGIVVNSGYTRLTARVNVDYEISKKFSMGNRIYVSYADQKGLFSEQAVLTSLYDWVPYWSIFTATGEVMHNIENRNSAYTYALKSVNQKQIVNASMFNYWDYKFNKYLNLTVNLSGQATSNRQQTYKPSILVGTSASDRTTGTDVAYTNYNWMNENYLTYSNNSDVHIVSAVIGNSVQYWRSDYAKMVGLDYTTDELYTINFASQIDSKNTLTTVNEHSLLSFFARATYSYKSKYLFAGNIRVDASSRFGKSRRWGSFPSASIGWRLSDEVFMKWSKPVLTDAKLRFSYGITGNEAIGNYDARQIYSPGSYYEGVSGIAPTTLAYDDLGWEKTAQTNIGLDLSLLNNRLRITFDYYDKRTSDLLYNVQLPKETGYYTMRRNVGSMSNKGLELSVGFDVLQKKGWKWNIDFSISKNESRIKKLADGTPFYTGAANSIYVQEGARIGEFYGYKHDGIFKYDESNAFTKDWEQLTPVFEEGVFQNCYLLNGVAYDGEVYQKKYSDGSILKGGDINWLDSNEQRDGIITTDDRVKLGCAQPDFFGGLNTTLSYRGLSLFVSFYYSFGGDIYNLARKSRNSFQYMYTAPEPEVLNNMWTKPGDDAIYPRPVSKEYNRLGPSDLFIEDASFIRLRNLKLSYRIPSKWANYVYMKGASVYFYGNNLLTWTAYKGFDPEFSGSNALNFGIDQNRYPRKRELGFGVNINF